MSHNANRSPQHPGGRGRFRREHSDPRDEQQSIVSRLQVDFTLPATSIGPVLRQRGAQAQRGNHQGLRHGPPMRQEGPYNAEGNHPGTAPATQAAVQYTPMYRPPHLLAQNLSENHHAALSMSSNYRGSATRPANYSEDISDAENTSVWLCGLSPATTYTTLMEKLVNTGKIYAVHINAPNGQHFTCAAKIQFWTVEGREWFIHTISRELINFDNGYKPTIELNRIKTSAQGLTNRSRVITITGPRAIVNEEILTRFFTETIVYQMDRIDDTRSTPEQGGMIWYFASFRLQAQSAHRKLTDRVMEARLVRHKGGDGQGWEQIQVGWGRDPCERLSTLAPSTLASA